MTHAAILAAAFAVLTAGTASAASAEPKPAPTPAPAPAPAESGWREETAMAGVQYVGRVPESGELLVEGWRNDGGMYVSDELKSFAYYTSAERLAIATETFRHREPDGVAAWTIHSFMSFPGDREKMGLAYSCGLGADFEAHVSETELVIGVVDFAKVPHDKELYAEGIVAAAKVSLSTGTIEPIGTEGVYCIQMLGD